MDFLTRKLAGYVLTILWASTLAAAGHNAPLSHVLPNANVLTTAVARTSPSRTLVDRVCVLNDLEHPKSFSRHVSPILENNKRRLNCLAERPPKVVHATAHQLCVNHEFVAPFGNCLSASTISNSPVVAPVVGLPLCCCPSAVTRFVITVRVDSVERTSVRSRSHVRKEIGERLSPSVADANSATTIGAIARLTFVLASRSHRLPGAVFTGRASRCVSMLALGNSSRTTAIRAISVLQCLPGDLTLCAALAATEPICASVSFRCFRQNGPLSEATADKTYKVVRAFHACIVG